MCTLRAEPILVCYVVDGDQGTVGCRVRIGTPDRRALVFCTLVRHDTRLLATYAVRRLETENQKECVLILLTPVVSFLVSIFVFRQ